MPEGAYLTILPHASCLLCHVTTEKVGAREAQIIEQEVREAAPSKKWKIVMDLKDVTLLASMGLGMLVSMHKSCAAEGGKLVVCGVKGDILELLKITHLERILKIAPERDGAIKVIG